MTKEALEKEAKKYGKKATAWLEDREPLDQRDIENAYLAGAEPREKQIEIDAEQIRVLQKQNGELKAIVTNTKAVEESFALQTIQLSKAKELIERLLKTSCNSDVLILLPNCSEVLRVRAEAEQFIKDSEVEK